MIKRNPMIIKRNIELWKPIKNFPGYAISNLGRVKSLERTVERDNGRNQFWKERILKQGKDNHGYLRLGLYLKKKQRNRTVHLIVINHFGPSKPSPLHECNHSDGNKTNNWWTNLEWMTPKENIQHADNTGLRNIKGENNGRAKLTKQQVIKIRKLYKTGKYSYLELGKRFEVSNATIGYIVNFKSWRYV